MPPARIEDHSRCGYWSDPDLTCKTNVARKRKSRPCMSTNHQPKRENFPQNSSPRPKSQNNFVSTTERRTEHDSETVLTPIDEGMAPDLEKFIFEKQMPVTFGIKTYTKIARSVDFAARKCRAPPHPHVDRGSHHATSPISL